MINLTEIFTTFDENVQSRKNALDAAARLLGPAAQDAVSKVHDIHTYLVRLQNAYDALDDEARQFLPDAVRRTLRNLSTVKGSLTAVLEQTVSDGLMGTAPVGLNFLAVPIEHDAAWVPVPEPALHVYTAVVMRPEHVLNDFHAQAANPWVGEVHAVGEAEAVDGAKQLAAEADNDPRDRQPKPEDYIVAALFAGPHRNLLGD